ALTPGVWLLFVLKYSRGNFQVSIRKWLPIVALLTALPIAAITLFPEGILAPSVYTGTAREFQIGLPGFVLYLCLVISSALILINVERTFRAAVGTMRWRIKYMVLGTAVIFTAKLYTSSQVLLFRTHSFSFDIVNAVALILACALFLNGL